MYRADREGEGESADRYEVGERAGSGYLERKQRERKRAHHGAEGNAVLMESRRGGARRGGASRDRVRDKEENEAAKGLRDKRDEDS